jgi:hypothetical protein
MQDSKPMRSHRPLKKRFSASSAASFELPVIAFLYPSGNFPGPFFF